MSTDYRAISVFNEEMLRAVDIKVVQTDERTRKRHALFSRMGYSEEGVVYRKVL